MINNCDQSSCETNDDCEPVLGVTPTCVDGRCQPGLGPLLGSGTCLDLAQGTITSAAAGPVGSKGAPLNDLTFLTVLPNTFERTGDFGNVPCADPPIYRSARPQGRRRSRCVAG